jgi:hypothetical protein
MNEEDKHSARLALVELVADFLCYLDRDGGAVNDEHFEQNVLISDLLMQSLGLEIIDVDNDGKLTAQINIGFGSA